GTVRGARRRVMRGKPEFNDNDLVVGYYRYSSSSQNEASIEQQRELVHRRAEAQGLQVVREYTDAAKTGTNTERPEFQLMLRELPSIRPSYVAVWKNDRLGRDRMDLLKVKNAIRMAGAKLQSRGKSGRMSAWARVYSAAGRGQLAPGPAPASLHSALAAHPLAGGLVVVLVAALGAHGVHLPSSGCW